MGTISITKVLIFTNEGLFEKKFSKKYVDKSADTYLLSYLQ